MADGNVQTRGAEPTIHRRSARAWADFEAAVNAANRKVAV